MIGPCRSRTALRGLPLSLLALAVVHLAGPRAAVAAPPPAPSWSEADRVVLRSLSLLPEPPPLPPSPSNAWADDARAAAFGEALFFDQRLSAEGDVACATCHQPRHAFADTLARSLGRGETRRNAPTVLGAAHQRWLYWDGRRDSLWAQALTPIEHPQEQGLDRLAVVRLLARDSTYRARYAALFGESLPPVDDAARFPAHATPLGDAAARQAWAAMAPADRNRIDAAFARVGKVLAAFERTLLPAPSRFDRFVAALLAGDAETADDWLDGTEQRGLKLFIGERAQCTRCHNGPMLSNGGFHNIGLIAVDDAPRDAGRAEGVARVRADPFNCAGPWSDAGPGQCPELQFMRARGVELLGAFRVPTLRNVARTAPYMHDGRFATLAQVLAHYVAAPAQGILGHQELEPLALSPGELDALAAFLRALNGMRATDAQVAAGQFEGVDAP